MIPYEDPWSDPQYIQKHGSFQAAAG